ncbi:hypothetical protein KR009_001638 [Drosophila setifemur]|nr:hypothetical protein KR009_001638 [Drosophila setifemur]
MNASFNGIEAEGKGTLSRIARESGHPYTSLYVCVQSKRRRRQRHSGRATIAVHNEIDETENQKPNGPLAGYNSATATLCGKQTRSLTHARTHSLALTQTPGRDGMEKESETLCGSVSRGKRKVHLTMTMAEEELRKPPDHAHSPSPSSVKNTCSLASETES